MARPAVCAWVERSKVKRILGHLVLVILGRDVARVAGDGEPEEDVRADDSECGGHLLARGEKGPDAGQVHVLAAGEEEDEEDEDRGVSVVKHVVAKPGHR